MNKLASSFPEKDRELIHKFLNERNFESLWELVCSSIYIVRKYKDRYEADLSDMNVFKSELSNYMDQLDIEEYEEDDEEMIDDYEEY